MKNLVKLFRLIALAAISVLLIASCADSLGDVSHDPPSLPTLSGTVSITGTTEVGQTLTANTDALGGSGEISYQWRRVAVNGETSNIGPYSTYIIQSNDIGFTITVTVTRSNNSGSITSEPRGPIGLPPLTGTVNIIGAAQVGQTLTANTDALGGSGTISYKWMRGGTSIGTDSSTYIIQATDAGSTIVVRVTRTGNSDNIDSAATAIVVDIGTLGLAFVLINNSTAYSVSGGTATATSVIIPATYNGLPVTEIRNNGFWSYTSMTSITIPNSVTSIDNSAFWGCTGLTNITIPNSVTSIGNNAFRGCTGLTSITIPDSVTSIGMGAFLGCTGLTSITIPDSVTSIGAGAFRDCTGLASMTSITIPSSVTSIGQRAFASLTGLTSITIPFVGNTLNGTTDTNFGWIFGGVSTWGDQNSGIPASLKTVIVTGGNSIPADAFLDCTGLTNITIPNSVTSIGNSAFRGCTGLTSITIPNSVTFIGHSAFRGCTGLTSITIPNSVTFIGAAAFQDCTGLTSITIPNSVTTIGHSAFSDCTGLTSVTLGTIESANFYTTAFPGNLFSVYFVVSGGGAGTYTRPSGSSNFWTKQ